MNEPQTRYRLLLVDDDPSAIMVLHRHLESIYDTRFATSGPQAIELAESYKPDLILLDLVMPGMDGDEVLKVLRAQESTREVPIVFVTARNDPESESLGLRAGADDFITKPINADVLLARVALHLEKLRLRRLNDEHRERLEQEVLERTLSLKIAKEAAESADRLKTTILRNLNHEFRTPMNGILGMLGLAQTRVSDARLAGYLNHAKVAADRLYNTLSSLVELATAETNRMSLDEAPLSVHHMLDSLRRQYAQIATAQGLHLTLSTGDCQIPELLGDYFKIRQVVGELIGNAIKFSQHGEVRVFAELEQLGEAAQLCVQVSDQGMGIAPQFQRHIFEPFFQVDGSATRSHEVNGIGLTLCHRLASAMGGFLTVSSVPGEGSTFRLCLPIKVAAASGLPERSDEEVIEALRTRHGEATILVAEDDAIISELIRETLVSAGLTVLAAENGQKALEFAKTADLDLILLDLMMPVMSGLDAARAIRALPLHQATPILAVTARSSRDDREAALAAGMNGYVAKPIAPETLRALILEWLERASSGGAV